MTYKIFCTHYSKLTHRKDNINNFFKSLDCDILFVESHEIGVDLLNNPYTITDRELSLWLKHLDIHKLIVDSDLDYAFIIEDDIYSDFDLPLTDFFDKIVNEKNNSDIIFFGGTYNMMVHNPHPNKLVYEGYNTSRCAHGYFVTKNTSNIIVNSPKLNQPFDHALNEYIIENKLNTSWTYPHIKQKTVEGIENSSLR